MAATINQRRQPPPPPRSPETRVIAASPRARLARLPEADRRLLLLLVGLGPEAARERIDLLASGRRDQLAPLLAEIVALPSEDRRALFAAEWASRNKPHTGFLNAKLRREPRRLATLMIAELAPGIAPSSVDGRPADPAFTRTLAGLAREWLAQARGRPSRVQR